MSTEECRREFGYQLLGRVGVRAKAVLEVAVEPLFMARPVTKLVEFDRVKVRDGADCPGRRHDDVVQRGDVDRLVAACLDVSVGRLHKGSGL